MYVYKPASDPETIAQGLREGWIVPAANRGSSPSDFDQQASPATPEVVSCPQTLVGDSEWAEAQSSLFGPTYQVIYADPPWQYGIGGARGGQYGALDYPTMATADICALPVSLLAADDAALFLWFTGSFMVDAVAVCSAWGFRFVRIDKVWAKKTRNGKPHAVVGPWGMSDAEFLLLGVRGSMASTQAERGQYTVVDEAYPGRHSAKPEIFRRQIEARFPNVRRLELFAREAAPNWDIWGNEVSSAPGVAQVLEVAA